MYPSPHSECFQISNWGLTQAGHYFLHSELMMYTAIIMDQASIKGPYIDSARVRCEERETKTPEPEFFSMKIY